MILTCNSCSKKFVVPDEAITASGRIVQCGSCGNKWRQFPIDKVKKTRPAPSPKEIVTKPQQVQPKIKKIKKKIVKKPREISLYSPEYLAKKHGIKISDTILQKPINKYKKDKISFGFYNYLILFIFFTISISRILYFAQDLIVTSLPISEFYLKSYFESIRNIFEIWKSLITY